MRRRWIKRTALIAGGLVLLAVLAAAGLVYSWTFTPHGRVDPEVGIVLRMARNGLPFDTVPVEQIRERVRKMSVRLWDDPRPLHRVEDRQVPGVGEAFPVRIYWPAPGERLPILIYYHGGGFVIGDIESYDGLCREISGRSGAIVVSVGYRLAPEQPYPAAADDSYAAVRWAHEHAAEIGGDASRIAVGGDSAGGNLAAVTALRARDLGGPPLVFQLLIYPILDLAERDTESHRLFDKGYMLDQTDFVIDAYVPDPAARRAPDVSPLLAENLHGLPPVLVITAEFDPLRDDGETYARRLQQSGVTARASRYEGVVHGFVGVPFVRKSKKALDEAVAALRAAFDGRPLEIDAE